MGKTRSRQRQIGDPVSSWAFSTSHVAVGVIAAMVCLIFAAINPDNDQGAPAQPAFEATAAVRKSATSVKMIRATELLRAGFRKQFQRSPVVIQGMCFLLGKA